MDYKMDLSQHTAIIVDDTKDICEIFSVCLEDYDIKTVVAYSGFEALELVKNQHVDFILSDIKMPNGSGLDLLKGLQSIDNMPITIMMMTGYTDLSKEEFVELGASRFYQKPINIEKIVEFIQSSIKNDKAA